MPLTGAVIVLHNMRVVEDDRIKRLESSNRSYLTNEKLNNDKFFQNLNDFSTNETWRFGVYKNISEVGFTVRTIKELKEILDKLLEGELCFSEIE